uniref:proton-translocating NAD(P)(+) transhydrogenase n=1 Tax=Strombidinopsis acuminata TaxID=141414 RepID=A0A7S3WQN7_9SPIT
MSDAAYTEVGCTIGSRDQVIAKSNMLFCITPPVADFGRLRDKCLVSWVGRLTEDGKAIVTKAAVAGVMLIDVTAVPRITIAQQMDCLSSQAKCAGHRAVIEAAHNFQRFTGAEMTAAGKYPPSNCFVLGCGVAGLEAIGKSKALGCAVSAWDVRDVSDQVQSMGAKWVKVDFKEDGAGQGGYAKESSEAFKNAQQATFLKQLKEVDIAICTAAIPGRRSPLLITKEAVAEMKPGSVIVDLAAQGGGNCELTKQGEVYVTPNKIIIIGYTDMPARMATQASAMFGQNMVNMLRYIHAKEGSKALLANINKHLAAGAPDGDIISRSIVCCKGGNKIEMPPPPQPTPPKPKTEAPAAAKKEPPSPAKQAMGSAVILSCAVLFGLLMGEGTQASLLTTFLLAGAAGYQAVWGVAHALHTPLMSVTNAISGMTAVGGLLLLADAEAAPAKGLAAAAIVISSINIIGGFVVSQRMLNLFRRPGMSDYSVFMFIPGLILCFAALTHPELISTVSTISSLLCVAAIGGLASMSTADAGCKFGMVGVLGAVTSCCMTLSPAVLSIALVLMAIGGSVGLVVGVKVSPMALPQTVAAFHSLVGAAATCTSIGSFYKNPVAGANMENIAAIFGDIIGAITLTGSIVAFGKLNGNLSSKALNLPGKNILNLSMLTACIVIGTLFCTQGKGDLGISYLLILAAIASVMGYHLVASVGGGDMPVCVTVLNSYSGWALVAEGFLLKSPVLTVVGSLIGCSGAILTKIMCDAMNRDIFNVIFGGMNVAAPSKKAGDEAPKIHVETSVANTAELMASAKEVLIVPGYGMAVARAQGSVGEIASACREAGITVKFGIHPVAGRMPGQMNVLLAEAGVPHEWVLEMDEVNPEMEKIDVVLVVGANDITNSAAQEVEGCSIWGMPVIEVWRSKKVIFCKRSMAGGYADLENPVFFKENTEMLLGDAKKTADQLAANLRQRLEKV